MAEYRAGPLVRQPTHPGAILRGDVLPGLSISVTEAARSLGVSRQALPAVLAERAAITVEMAVRQGKFCRNGPGLWLRMQQAHNLWRVTREMAEVVLAIPTARAA